MADDPFVSLYRRFRPGRFDELRGQDHVVRALQSAVRDDRVSHAYLFSGPRGTGKTSSARILAKALNCAAPVDGEPCGVCPSCVEITQGTSLDVHELDAASNNGVDAMRDLVAHAALGTPGRWKVYIVDEVHMLSTAAANALLKTLEEPPSHVVFVLATTDPQKVPQTIRSRTQHLEFRLIGADTLRDLLESVREAAGLKVDEESVQAAVRRGRGSARDALSALDQVVASGTSDAARPELSNVLAAMGHAEVSDVLVSLSTLLAAGWGPQQLATELVDDLRQVFLAALAPELCAESGPARVELVSLAESMGLARVVRSMEILGRALIDMRDAPDAQVVLEIALVRATRPDLDSGIEALIERVSALERHAPTGGPPGRGPAPADVAPASPPASPPPTPPLAAAASSDVGRRPSLGAVRRRQDAAPNPQANATPTPDAAGVPVPTGAEGGTIATAPGGGAPPIAAEAIVAGANAAGANAAGANAAGAPNAAGPTVDRDGLTQAWGDSILRNLPARAKALFSAGRFVGADEKGAQFALPNAAHRDRCAELAPQVQAALTAHFGTPVSLVLVVDGASTGGPPDGSPPPRAPTGLQDDVALDEEDPADLVAMSGDEADHASAAEARLLEAFPGTSEVAE
jgi:DNA polymerase III subunit gamma/tau